jgi:orotidine-5'-phosphate decarboxylase
MTFGHRLRDALGRRGRLCVGIDPHPELLDAWGVTDSAFGLEKFALGVVEAVADLVPVIKPQSAFFERHGSAGIAVLERTCAAAREQGALVLLDAKRGDIGSTMRAYAEAYLVPSAPMAVDAVTVSPYLGFGSLQPMLETAERHGAGVFVLALTSNPEAPQFQHATVDDGRTVAGAVLDAVASANADADGWGSVGAVVGATIGETRENLYVKGPLLVPGIGAQGGTVDDVRRIFGRSADHVLPSVSREVLAAGPDRTALRDVTARLVDEFAVLGG